MKSTVSHNESFYDGVYRKKVPLLYYLKNRYISFAHRNKFSPILSRLSLRNKKVLEVGFGSGMILMALSKKNTAYGLELSESAIKSLLSIGAIFRRKRLHLIKYSGNGKIPLDEKFDLVISSHVLEHVPDDVALLNEMSRVLDKDGYLYLQLPLEKDEFPVNDPNHVRNYTVESLKNILSTNRLEILELIPSGYSNAFLSQPHSLIVRFVVKVLLVSTPYRLFLSIEKMLFGRYYPSQILAICRKMRSN